MTTTSSEFYHQKQLTPVRLAAASNVAGTYSNGPSNTGVGATLTIAASTLTIDSVAVANGNRVLLSAQTTGYQNGIYVVSGVGTAVVLTRSYDFQTIEQMRTAEFIPVAAGTSYAGAFFTVIEPLVGNVGVDTPTFTGVVALLPTYLQYASVPITLAAFLAMYDAPVQLVAAPGANKALILKQVQIAQTYGSAALASGGVSAIQYDSTVHGAGVIASTTLSAATYQQTASSIYTYNPGVVVLPFSTTVNKGLYLSCLTGDFTTGTGSTFVANVQYYTIPTA